jgi:hypothetical protein
MASAIATDVADCTSEGVGPINALVRMSSAGVDGVKKAVAREAE